MYSLPGIGAPGEGLNALVLERMNCEGTTGSSQDFDALDHRLGFTIGQQSASVRDPGRSLATGEGDRHW